MPGVTNRFIDISVDEEDLKEIISALEETGRYDMAENLKDKMEKEK